MLGRLTWVQFFHDRMLVLLFVLFLMLKITLVSANQYRNVSMMQYVVADTPQECAPQFPHASRADDDKPSTDFLGGFANSLSRCFGMNTFNCPVTL